MKAEPIKQTFHAIFSWSYAEWGGAQIYFLSIIKNAPPNWRFTIVLPKNSKPDLIEFFAAYGVEFEFFEKSFDSQIAVGVRQKIRRQLQRLAAEISAYRHLRKMDLAGSVLHTEHAPWQSWIFLYLLTRRGDVFVTMHNALPKTVSKWRAKIWRRRLDFLLKRRKFHFFAANQNAVESVKRFVSADLWDKLTLTRASINPAEIERVLAKDFDRAKLLEKHGLPTDKFIVLCVGQFIDRKGRWIFLEAAQKIAAQHQDLFFVWLTPRMPSRADCRKIEDFNLQNSFRLVLSATVGGEREDVLQFFRIADVFALPSLWEGLPIAVLEALALGLPTVATDLNAIPEAIRHLETGLLIEVGSGERLAEAVLRLYRDRDLREKLAKQGREYALTNFDERLWARVVLENYEKCLKK